MIASFMALILSNIGKIVVEQFNSIEEYAYYSFGMTVINLLLICFTSISTVMYPMLKRIDKNEYGKQFNSLNKYFDIMALSGLLLYFAAVITINIIFTDYTPVLKYLNILFVTVIFQGKMTLLNNTYYKILRQEKKMLLDNIISIILFALLCLISQDVVAIAIITLIVLAHRAIDSEIFLRRKMDILKDNTFILLLVGIIIFLISTSINYWIGLLAYLIFYTIYLIKNKNKFIDFIHLILKRKSR